jgi:hypothetical protein
MHASAVPNVLRLDFKLPYVFQQAAYKMKKEEWVFLDVPFHLHFCCQVLPLVRQEQHCAGSSGGWSACWDDDRPNQKKI